MWPQILWNYWRFPKSKVENELNILPTLSQQEKQEGIDRHKYFVKIVFSPVKNNKTNDIFLPSKIYFSYHSVQKFTDWHEQTKSVPMGQSDITSNC